MDKQTEVNRIIVFGGGFMICDHIPCHDLAEIVIDDPVKLPKKICGACHRNYYCNRECQTSDWPIHKETCKKLVSCNVASMLPLILKKLNEDPDFAKASFGKITLLRDSDTNITILVGAESREYLSQFSAFANHITAQLRDRIEGAAIFQIRGTWLRFCYK